MDKPIGELSCKERHLTPAELVVILFGGVKKLADAIGAHKSQVCRWQKGTDRGKGLIPSARMAKILVVAAERKINLTAQDLIFGRTIQVKK